MSFVVATPEVTSHAIDSAFCRACIPLLDHPPVQSSPASENTSHFLFALAAIVPMALCATIHHRRQCCCCCWRNLNLHKPALYLLRPPVAAGMCAISSLAVICCRYVRGDIPCYWQRLLSCLYSSPGSPACTVQSGTREFLTFSFASTVVMSMALRATVHRRRQCCCCHQRDLFAGEFSSRCRSM